MSTKCYRCLPKRFDYLACLIFSNRDQNLLNFNLTTTSTFPPLSVLPALSKVLERVLNERLLESVGLVM